MVSPNASLPAASEGLPTNWTAKPILGPHKTIAEIDFGRNNNFNLIRMFAAICVLVSHAWPIALHGPVAEPLQVLTGYKLGTLSVSIFFATSGYFITKSFDRRGSLPDFILARVARIYPALAVVLILSTIILEFVCGNISFGHYFGQFRTVRYVIVNLLLLKHQYDLPGIFVYNGHPGAINGSIWSLRPEVECYFFVVVLGLVGVLNIRTAFLVPLSLAFVTLIFVQSDNGLLNGAGVLSLPFALGGAAYLYRDYVRLNRWIAIGLLGLAIGAFGHVVYPMVLALALAYTTLWLGFSNTPLLHTYNRLGDYSYGFYLYAWPVEQALAWVFPGITPVLLAAAAIPVTLLFAVASWQLIEAPALRHRHVLRQMPGKWKVAGITLKRS